ILSLIVLFLGCGTTRWSDTQRTATEQLLISDAMDRAVSDMDFSVVAGRSVYLDFSPIRGSVDAAYLVSTARQHLLACDCILREKPEDADFVVELRAGAVGTDRRDLFYGVPSATIPSPVPGTSGATVIPELPLIKRTEQRGIVKIAAFIYDRQTGRPIWQSGTSPIESKARDVWVLGAGPFSQGTIYKGTRFAGGKVPLLDGGKPGEERSQNISVTREIYFDDPPERIVDADAKPEGDKSAKSSNVKPVGLAIPDNAQIGGSPSSTKTESSLPKLDFNASLSALEKARKTNEE
ncbi:MAG: DUF6655 family protein, partial [Planctomycetota bacterium]